MVNKPFKVVRLQGNEAQRLVNFLATTSPSKIQETISAKKTTNNIRITIHSQAKNKISHTSRALTLLNFFCVALFTLLAGVAVGSVLTCFFYLYSIGNYAYLSSTQVILVSIMGLASIAGVACLVIGDYFEEEKLLGLW